MSTVTYTITVPVIHLWATGAHRSSGVCTLLLTEERTVLGAARAIDKACEHLDARTRLLVNREQSPTIEPNPAELGWPIGREGGRS